MAKNFRIYFILLKANVLGIMSYRQSYLLEIVGMILLTTVQMLAIVFLFDAFEEIGGWKLWQVIYLYAIATMAMGTAQLFSSGLNYLPELIQTGEFDKYLIRPVNPLVYILPYSISIHRIGRILQGLLIVAYIFYQKVEFSFFNLYLVMSTYISVTLIYFSLFLLGATVTFWTVQSAELFNSFTYGGLELSKYPVSIYQPWLRNIFLFFVPIGLVTYFPTIILFGLPNTLSLPTTLGYTIVPIAIVFFILSLWFWKIGVNHYQSTGS